MTDVAGRDYVQALKGRRTLSGAWLLTYRLRDTVTLVNVEFEYKRETLQWILSSGYLEISLLYHSFSVFILLNRDWMTLRPPSYLREEKSCQRNNLIRLKRILGFS